MVENVLPPSIASTYDVVVRHSQEAAVQLQASLGLGAGVVGPVDADTTVGLGERLGVLAML